MASLYDEEFSSDSEDDDYVPESTLEATSDEDVLPSDDEIQTKEQAKKKGEVEKNEPIEESPLSDKSEVDEKQRANDLFKNFLAEVEAEKKEEGTEIESASGRENAIMATPEINSPDSGIKSGEGSCKSTPDEPLCELFDFAGETVAVSVKDGTQIASTENSATDSGSTMNRAENVPGKPKTELPVKPKGLQSVLGTIMNKGKKLTVLEKTSLDWNKFKKENNLSEDLETFNKGKGGYIERKRFLERSDVRSYEIERDMRMVKRKKNT